MRLACPHAAKAPKETRAWTTRWRDPRPLTSQSFLGKALGRYRTRRRSRPSVRNEMRGRATAR